MYDRRKHQRYLLNQSCYLTCADSVGTIVDICMGGMSCMCLAETCCQGSSERGIDIFCKEAALFAQDLPIKILDSIVLPGEFGKWLKFRKCHVKFDQLDYGQENNIKDIILEASRL